MDSEDPSERAVEGPDALHRRGVIAFGQRAEHATKLRELGKLLDDLVGSVRNRDPLLDGRARRLLAEWHAIGEPLLFFPVEIRTDGHLVLAAESTRARFVLPAFQAGLRALTLERDAQPSDLLALARAFAHLEQGSLSQRDLFDWLWSGNPEGLSVLLGHPMHEAAANVADDPIASAELWNAHASAAVNEWNVLAQEIAQTMDAPTIASRYRAPVERLTRRMAAKDLLLEQREVCVLREALHDKEQERDATLCLLLQRPELARWLTPREAAEVMRLGLAHRASTSRLLACVDAMSPTVARGALAACPELLLVDPARLLPETCADGHKQLRALVADRGAGARRLHELLLDRHVAELPPSVLRAFYEAVAEAGLYELLHDAWLRASLDLVRLLALELLGRNRADLEAALAKRPVSPSDGAAIHALLAELRSLST